MSSICFSEFSIKLSLKFDIHKNKSQERLIFDELSQPKKKTETNQNQQTNQKEEEEKSKNFFLLNSYVQVCVVETTKTM